MERNALATRATSDHNSASTRAGFWGADSIDPKSKIKRYLVTHTHTHARTNKTTTTSER